MRGWQRFGRLLLKVRITDDAPHPLAEFA
jgi:hypothetical protein